MHNLFLGESAFPPSVCVVIELFAICSSRGCSLSLFCKDLHEPGVRMFYPELFTPNWAPGPPLQPFLLLYHSYECDLLQCSSTQPPSIVYKIWKMEQQLGALTRSLVLTKCIIFGEGEKQTEINWECATNSYGNKVSKYQIIACVSKCLLTRFASRICKAAPATLLHPWRQGTCTEIWI